MVVARSVESYRSLFSSFVRKQSQVFGVVNMDKPFDYAREIFVVMRPSKSWPLIRHSWESSQPLSRLDVPENYRLGVLAFILRS